jgi:capsular polysaccharide transport system permease protein
MVNAGAKLRSGTAMRGLAVQTHVVGALLMRELHTRFGRDNIGYLWAVFEPGLLALAVTVMYLAASSRTGFGMDPIPFWVVGYTPFCMFRFMVLRAEAAIESNRTLLYHRMVTITDLMIARNLLEFASAAMAMAILVGFAWLCGVGNLPDRPILMFAGMAQLWFLSFGLSLIVAAASENSTVVQRIVHPATYVSLPLSGAFFLLKWIPHPFREYLAWSPLISPFEQIREGQFAMFDSDYVCPAYVIGWSLVLTILGLFAIRITRRRMHLE